MGYLEDPHYIYLKVLITYTLKKRDSGEVPMEKKSAGSKVPIWPRC